MGICGCDGLSIDPTLGGRTRENAGKGGVLGAPRSLGACAPKGGAAPIDPIVGTGCVAPAVKPDCALPCPGAAEPSTVAPARLRGLPLGPVKDADLTPRALPTAPSPKDDDDEDDTFRVDNGCGSAMP